MSKKLTPAYLFEASWEVCNMVGGIYTVLSTRAATLKKIYGDKLVFIGPDVWAEKQHPYFKKIHSPTYKKWIDFTHETCGLKIRVGRWNIPGEPIAVLIDFTPLYQSKNRIYAHVWEKYGVNSLVAYGDYDESSMFGYASGMVMESYYRFFELQQQKVIAHFNEWMTAFGAFYIKEHLPSVASIFTTHATTIGRSIAGNNKPLYGQLHNYYGDQMADELNVASKHSAEKTAAHLVDCFTTVSEITAEECTRLLEKRPDIVTPNGFEDDFVPKGNLFTKKRNAAGRKLKEVAETLLGYRLQNDALFVATAGRYEYKNKGIDVFIESLKQLSEGATGTEIVAFIMVPAHIKGVRHDLHQALSTKETLNSWNRLTTHELYDYDNDPVIQALRRFQLSNQIDNRVKVIFVPAYLTKDDPVFQLSYYDLLQGIDLTVFPSYYEPWGYTPLESIAFSVPTITTDLSGFGQWVSHKPQHIDRGVGIIHRSDDNPHEVSREIASMISKFATLSSEEKKNIREKAKNTAEKALWKHFIRFYEEAYAIALSKKETD
jgi:glycosyltransferase involved in cell wall biosynthesis